MMKSFAMFLSALCIAATAHAQSLTVVSVSPTPNVVTAAIASPITVTFNKAVKSQSITGAHFWAFGRWSGTASGPLTLSNGDKTVTLTPAQHFSAGELVMVILSHDIQAADGAFLRQAGYSYLFWTAARPAQMTFAVCDQFSTRTTPREPSHSYGGFAADLNHDGWLDLGIINEDTFDVRVFLHDPNPSGQYGDLLQPTNPCGSQSSPNETGDFNHDGKMDVCTANVLDDSVSILLGNGNGSFAPQQVVGVGVQPHGICVLDADGDGDMDIACTNFGGDNLSLLLNNAQGVFSTPTFWPTGGNGEFAIAAADMNADGIMDLVVGAFTSHQIVIRRGNGDATFSSLSNQNCGGTVRQLAVGDVDGDGDVDVGCVDGLSDVAAILRNNGSGFLSAPATYPVDHYAGASDFGDLDGDGDLDWMVSSFLGNWQLLVNNGSGTFAFGQSFTPPQVASCSIVYDVDNDGDLDLALIDEIEDVVVVMKNSGTTQPADLNGDGAVGPADLATLLSQWGQCQPPCNADIAPPGGDGVVGPLDLATLLSSWT